MTALWRLLRSLPLILLTPILAGVPLLSFLTLDLLARLFRLRPHHLQSRPSTRAASVVIPNWNGRDLLEKYLASVVEALSANPDNEVIVVDNGSTDGSVEFLKQHFPSVRTLALPQNRGFGGGSNAGFRAARNDIVVLLNSDMRVEPDFLTPLMKGFTDPEVFSVSCQIFFTDPARTREESGLTETWWENGAVRVRHRIDSKVDRIFPCAYGGGGSSAYDRRKFLELGGFDELYAPFYGEDTDIGYLAWKRGWKVLYQPASHVYHEHRGTIGKRFTPVYIQSVLHKNFILFCWKNIHEWRRLLSHFAYAVAAGLVSAVFGPSPERPALAALGRAFLQLPAALRSRWAARRLAAISDTEAFRRPYGGYFRDRFQTLLPNPPRLRILFVSPYPICPPIHGGAVFMEQTCRQLAAQTDLSLLVVLEKPGQERDHARLVADCTSADFLEPLDRRPKNPGAITPAAVREFASRDLHWIIHRKLYLDEIDALQLEYLPMAQYHGDYRQLATAIFEHDIYFQSIARALAANNSLVPSLKPALEYMRALRYELKILPRFDRVQVCTRQNADHLASFLPHIRDRIRHDLRAGIELARYSPRYDAREQNTLLFSGSFRHLPNLAALHWFTEKVMPIILEQEPGARLIVVGSDPPLRHSLPNLGDALELRGRVEDIREPLSRYAVFVCPVRSGSGIRVKLLEAFAAGIPAVSTPLGAEGLAEKDAEICALAAEPELFAAKTIELLRNPDRAREMARRARRAIEKTRDMPQLTRALVTSYRDVIASKRRS